MDFIGKNCSVCSEAFREDDDIVVCPKCGAPYHRDCYAEKGKCIFPELHRSSKSWTEEFGTEKKEDVSDNSERICRVCGEKNPADAIVCSKCGTFLFGPEDMDRPQNNNEHDNFQNGNVPPFIFNGFNVFDTFNPETEDFDGVSGKELAEFTGNNPLYYLPLFLRLKKFGVSRINFAAFIFGGIWYLYRKQYLKGIIITLITFLVSASSFVVSALWSDKLFKAATEAIGSNPNYLEYLSWSRQNCSVTEFILMYTPAFLEIVLFIISLICALRANRSYYNHCLTKIRQIKQKYPDDDSQTRQERLIRAGGVNLGLSIMVVSCGAIILTALSMFFS